MGFLLHRPRIPTGHLPTISTGVNSGSSCPIYVAFMLFVLIIPYTTGKIPFCPESVFLPEMVFKIVWISLPNMICRIAFHQIYDFTDRHSWFRFYHVMDMVFIRLHMPDNYIMSLTFYIV